MAGSFSLQPVSDTHAETPQELLKRIREVLIDLEDQLNFRAQIYTSSNGTIPAGLKRDDVMIVFFRGIISLKVKTRSGFVTLNADMLDGLTKHGTNYKGHLSANIAPTTGNFPNPNDWGFFTHTGTAFYLCFNQAGTLKKVALT